jgi:hypothetical protein
LGSLNLSSPFYVVGNGPTAGGDFTCASNFYYWLNLPIFTDIKPVINKAFIQFSHRKIPLYDKQQRKNICGKAGRI